MEAEADLVNYGKTSSLEEDLERLSVDAEIESELKALKTPVVEEPSSENKDESTSKQ